MRTHEWVALAALFFSFPLHAASVLFIGNSFTQGDTASVPVIFDRLAQAGGQGDPDVVMRAVGGADFEYHATNATTLGMINSQLWDYVVLQNYSTEPTHFIDGTHSIAEHFQFGAQLYQQVMAKNPNARVILVETWSRAAAHPYFTGVSGPQSFASTAEMQSELRTNYAGLANALNQNNPGKPFVRVAPVGTAWELAGGLRVASDPQFSDLHGSDNYHGDDDGYFLAAATIYSTIYGQSPSGLAASPQVTSLGLSMDVPAARLEAAAWDAVQSVPEPGSAVLILAGSVMILRRRRLASARRAD
jgi:hypothetical protein